MTTCAMFYIKNSRINNIMTDTETVMLPIMIIPGRQERTTTMAYQVIVEVKEFCGRVQHQV